MTLADGGMIHKIEAACGVGQFIPAVEGTVPEYQQLTGFVQILECGAIELRTILRACSTSLLLITCLMQTRHNIT